MYYQWIFADKFIDEFMVIVNYRWISRSIAKVYQQTFTNILMIVGNTLVNSNY